MNTTKKRTKRDYSFIVGYVLRCALLVIVLVLSLIGASDIDVETQQMASMSKSYICIGIAFIVNGLYYIVCGFMAKKNRMQFWFDIGRGIACICIGIPIFFFHEEKTYYIVAGTTYLAMLLAGRIPKFFQSPTNRGKFLHIIVASICGLLIVLSAIDHAGYLIFFWLDLQIMAYISVFSIIAVVFSQIHLGTLNKVIQKTYAKEILAGLLVLIVAFSIVFYMTEVAFPTYLDALWYCFAIVTTIGFGDFTTVSIIGRALSVILGIYGIIVVSLITSIIVNFYNEVKTDPNDVIKEEVEAHEAETEGLDKKTRRRSTKK